MMFYAHKCTGCGKCAKVCPNNTESCDLCGKCTLYCPNDARKICGKSYSADGLLAVIEKDKAYYESSGGGVTFSGGECMLQSDFLAEILKLCKEKGIHTAVDTAGHVPWESFLKVIPYTDLFLYDVKAYTDELHKTGVGVSNKLIFDNLTRLCECCRDKITVRVPVMMGYNGTDEEIGKISAFVKDLGIGSVELLPYHRLGEHKYAALGSKAEEYGVPSEADIDRWRRNFI